MRQLTRHREDVGDSVGSLQDSEGHTVTQHNSCPGHAYHHCHPVATSLCLCHGCFTARQHAKCISGDVFAQTVLRRRHTETEIADPTLLSLGICRGFVPDIQVRGTHGREDLVNAAITSNAKEEEEETISLSN